MTLRPIGKPELIKVFTVGGKTVKMWRHRYESMWLRAWRTVLEEGEDL